MAEQAFKFPDEVAAETTRQGVPEEELQVEVIDDTPPGDKGREPMPKPIVEELEKDDLEEYSEKVKTRLSQMKKVWHDERREKEAALREREEAFRFAQAKDQEIKQLRAKLGAGEKMYIEEATKSANTDLATAKERLRQAYDSGDAGQITDAQEALTDAKLKIKEVQYFRPTLQQDINVVESQQQPQQTQAPVDHKATQWRDKNTWFGVDPEMTASALGLHEKLIRSGVDPRSDEYYRQVDVTMRRRFPEYGWEEDSQPRETESETKPLETKTPRKAASVVAPVTRSTAPRQIRLTKTQVALAKRLGLTNEAYAKELMKLENGNG
jgi:hypothetical protein